ncbi:hypothetical protein [Actinophytocola sp.]|uniref:COG4315 family predicted lipoprotein n=1 Tax=Actinophytocola sp. TaxID=1872138 RepID=UPI002EDAAFFE
MSTQDRRHTTTALAVFSMLGTAAVLAACGTSGSAGDTATSSTTVAVHTEDHSGLGRILVDSSGKTLYFTDQEADGTVRCVGTCLQFWFPAESGDAPSVPGVPALDVVRRADSGHTQLTYQGKPLYTFQLDEAAGDANGHDVEDDFVGTHFVWHAVILGESTPAPTTGGGGYGGGGY